MTVFKINNRAPIYIQIIDFFKMQIASGSYAPGEEIPSRRQLASELKINLNTVQRAYQEMEKLKMIYTDQNLPSRVTKDQSTINKMKHDILNEALQSVVSTALLLNVSITELQKQVADNYQIMGDEND